MARGEYLRIFCYDIGCNKRRRRVSRILEDIGSRVQFSVFESRMTERQLTNTVLQIEDVISSEDKLRVYTIGASGEKHSTVRGASAPIESKAGFWLF